MIYFYLICIIILEQELRLKRINDVHILLHNIPKQNFNMLDILIKHLCKYGNVLKLLFFILFEMLPINKHIFILYFLVL